MNYSFLDNIENNNSSLDIYYTNNYKSNRPKANINKENNETCNNSTGFNMENTNVQGYLNPKPIQQNINCIAKRCTLYCCCILLYFVLRV